MLANYATSRSMINVVRRSNMRIIRKCLFSVGELAEKIGVTVSCFQNDF